LWKLAVLADKIVYCVHFLQKMMHQDQNSNLTLSLSTEECEKDPMFPLLRKLEAKFTSMMSLPGRATPSTASMYDEPNAGSANLEREKVKNASLKFLQLYVLCHQIAENPTPVVYTKYLLEKELPCNLQFMNIALRLFGQADCFDDLSTCKYSLFTNLILVFVLVDHLPWDNNPKI
jgi:hypothetical protein